MRPGPGFGVSRQLQHKEDPVFPAPLLPTGLKTHEHYYRFSKFGFHKLKSNFGGLFCSLEWIEVEISLTSVPDSIREDLETIQLRVIGEKGGGINLGQVRLE